MTTPKRVSTDEADAIIKSCLDTSAPKSFFLYAGAGSGKTRSLVLALDTLRSAHGQRLRYRGKRISVITYTNAACDEIRHRLDHDPVISVSTTHSFVWELIKGFNEDIRRWLTRKLVDEIAELRDQLAKGRTGTKIAAERQRSLESKTRRLELLPTIKTFTYNPNGDNRERDSLNHAEVIQISAAFLREKPLMRQLLISGSPFVFVDEAQDTSKVLMESLLTVQAEHRDVFGLGIFGDTMQRIYADGKTDLGTSLPTDWSKPEKLVNHRCPRRVVRLINVIRSSVDSHQQLPSPKAQEGVVRLFIAPSGDVDKHRIEGDVRREMATASSDPLWMERASVKTLTLEHHMAARRMGFSNIFSPLDEIPEFSTGLRDGTLPLLRFFSDLVFPTVSAHRSGDQFAVAALVRKHSPLLAKENLRTAGELQIERVAMARQAVAELGALSDRTPIPTFLEVLQCVSRTGLFEIPESLYPFLSAVEDEVAEEADDADDKTDFAIRSKQIRSFLDASFSEIAAYREYVKGEAEFGTHQGVKGLEFPRVLVVIDDDEARGFMFSFGKLFQVTPRTPTDLSNEAAGKETGTDRTRRLFYVTCSRSERSLAIVVYSSSASQLKSFVTKEGWFAADEVHELG